MENTKQILDLIISWPGVVLIAVLALRKPITDLVNRFVKGDSGRARIGPVEVELGQLAEEGKHAVSELNRINELMAETRLLELEITEGNFGPVFSEEQRERMKAQINELKKLTSGGDS